MNKKLLIFDLDGTLVDTISDITYSINQMLVEYNLATHTEDAVRKMIGKGARNLITQALPEDKRVDDFIDETLECYRNFYEANLVVNTHAYNGILRVLQCFKSQGVKLAVLSNKDDRHVKTTVETLMPGIFDSVNGFSPMFPHKPSPEAVFSIMEEMKIDKNETAFIGDSSVDVLTAKNSGIYSVGVTWGFDGGLSFKEFVPDVIVNMPEQLLDI